MNKNKSKLYLAALKLQIMMRIFKVAFVLTLSLLFAGCPKDDDPVVTPVTPLADQAPVDLAKIDKFLDEYSMSVSIDYDVTFTKIPTPNPSNLLPIRTQYASILEMKTVNISDVPHKFYFIKMRQGTELEPSRVDSVFVSYRGRLMDEATTTFDQAQNPLWLTLDATIQGWREVFPEFKTGTFTGNGNGTVTYMNYGAGVMFIPSALAYYNIPQGSIPAYAPLIFSFKLRHLNYVDHDLDGIDSRDEDLNGDKKFTLEFDDTDGDGRLNYLDQDDDGDNFPTKFERKNPLGGYYSFATIPLCASGSNGKKRHLDPACHN